MLSLGGLVLQTLRHGGGSPGDVWILATGIWNDAGIWDDDAVWID